MPDQLNIARRAAQLNAILDQLEQDLGWGGLTDPQRALLRAAAGAMDDEGNFEIADVATGAAAGLPRSSFFRALKSLTRAGHIEPRGARSGRYALRTQPPATD